MCFGNTFSLPILSTFSAFHLISDGRQYGGLACILQSCLAIWCPAPSHKLLSMPPYHPFKHFLSWRRWRKVQRSHHRNRSGSINAIRRRSGPVAERKIQWLHPTTAALNRRPCLPYVSHFFGQNKISGPWAAVACSDNPIIPMAGWLCSSDVFKCVQLSTFSF